jgi:hypothetical protein
MARVRASLYHRRMGTALLLLVSYVLLVLGILVNWGMYDPTALLLLLTSFALVSLAFVWVSRDSSKDRKVPGVPVFAIAVLVLLLAAMVSPTAMYLATPLFETLYHYWLLLLAALVGLAYLAFRGKQHRVRRWVFIIAVAGALAFRAWIPIASPAPVIDVFTSIQESMQHLLDGQNPYNTQVSDVYEGVGDPGYDLKAYVYPPANIYPEAVTYRLTGDVRFLCVLAEMVVAFALWRLARRRWGDPIAELLVLLFNPRALFVIEQAWVDPLILMVFATYLLLMERRKPAAAAAAYGYMLFLKQYLLFAFFQWFILERSWKRIGIGLAVGAATLVPFAIWDWRALLDNGILFNFVSVPFRPESLTVFSFLSRTWGLQPPFGWAIVVGAVITTLTFIPQRRIQPLRGYLFALVLTTFGMFLFGTSGFANWYYLVGGFMIFLIALGARRSGSKAKVGTDATGFAVG